MTDEYDYLDLDDLLAASAAALGPAPEVRDWGLLESALARPRASVFGEDAYPDLPTKAAALLDSVVNKHALVDGNKRTGFVATALFLGLNGLIIGGSDDARYRLVMDVAEGALSGVPAIAERLRELVVRSP